MLACSVRSMTGLFSYSVLRVRIFFFLSDVAATVYEISTLSINLGMDEVVLYCARGWLALLQL